MSRRRLGLIGLAAGMILAVVPVSAANAAPASDDMSVSFDGVNFTGSPSGSLFDGISALVPGGSDERTLWIRNDGASTLVMRIDATDVSVSDAHLAAALTITADSSIGRTVSFATTEQCSLLLGEQYIAPRQVIAVTFDISLADALTGTSGQLENATADLVVAMRDAAAPAPADGECEGVHLPVLGTGTGTASSVTATRLSSTGADVLPWLLGAIAVLLGGSLAAFGGRKRRRESDRTDGA